MTNDPVVWAVLRVICHVSFSRPLWFWNNDGFCNHQLIKYPLQISIIKGIILFFPFLKRESSTFLFFLTFTVFVESFTIDWLWACFDKGGHWLSFHGWPFAFFLLRLCTFLTSKLPFHITCLRHEGIKVLRLSSVKICSNLRISAGSTYLNFRLLA